MNPSTPVVAAVWANLEGHVVSTLLLVVGGLGVVLGLASPQHTIEAGLGLLTVLLLAHGKLHEVLRARRENAESH